MFPYFFFGGGVSGVVEKSKFFFFKGSLSTNFIPKLYIIRYVVGASITHETVGRSGDAVFVGYNIVPLSLKYYYGNDFVMVW